MIKNQAMPHSKKKKTFFFEKNNNLLGLKKSQKVLKVLQVLYLLFECFHDTNQRRIKNKKKIFPILFFFKLSLTSPF